jgi:hypothetical protein
MAYQKRQKYLKTEKSKSWTRTGDKPRPNFDMKTKKPEPVFENCTVLEAIEAITANRKLSQKVSNVITCRLFDQYNPEYQEHIKAIAEEVRKQKLY